MSFFRMWDVDDSGSINVTEMTNIIATMDDVEGRVVKHTGFGTVYIINHAM